LKRFVVPPTWPSPPRRSWVPPKTWRPDPSWPPAPDDWRFWVDGRGNAVRGPIGRYGGPSRRIAVIGAAALVLFLGVNIWALSAVGLFGGSDDPAAVRFVGDDQSPPPSASPTRTPVVPPTTSGPPPDAHAETDEVADHGTHRRGCGDAEQDGHHEDPAVAAAEHQPVAVARGDPPAVLHPARLGPGLV
jgi:hypothetical protein